MTLSFGSLFAGIGGFDLGFARAEMAIRYQCEIDKQCQRVLNHHYPETRCLSDVRLIRPTRRRPFAVDVLCGGFPCQDISVAGRRAGLAGERSGLWTEFLRLIGSIRPTWVVIENVVGLLSSKQGRDMGTILRDLGKCGYGWAYRVLDLQFYRVPQRRRRVFIVGHSGGEFRSCAEVLFERESLPWDSPPCREAGERVAGTIESHVDGGGFPGTDGACDRAIVFDERNITSKTNRTRCEPGDPVGTMHASPMTVAYAIQERAVSENTENGPQGKGFQEDQGFTLEACHHQQAVAFQTRIARNGRGQPSETCPALTSAECGSHADTKPHVAYAGGVRRLLPRECLRLQSFPDNWLGLDPPLSDSAKYRMIGNAVAPIVAEWIGRRIMHVHHVK